MLTAEQIMAIGRMDARYGPPEQTFSPSWHSENPVAAEQVSFLRTSTREIAERTVSTRPRHVAHAGSGRTMRNDESSPPEGSPFADRT